MPYCPNCGALTDAGARFCPSCGTALTGAAPAVTSTLPLGNLSLVLVSLGDCTKTAARELLHELLSYTLADARRITDALPMQVAGGLTQEQALTLSQVFTEYGMDVAISDGRNFLDLSDRATSSIFSSTGDILAGAAGVLASITAANRVTNFLRWTLGDPFRFSFRPRYQRLPRLWSVHPYRRPGPRPAPRPPRPPRPVAPRPPRPAGPLAGPRPPRPAPGPRPAGPGPVRPAPVRPAGGPGMGPGGRGPGGRGPGGRGPGGRGPGGRGPGM